MVSLFAKIVLPDFRAPPDQALGEIRLMDSVALMVADTDISRPRIAFPMNPITTDCYLCLDRTRASLPFLIPQDLASFRAVTLIVKVHQREGQVSTRRPRILDGFRCVHVCAGRGKQVVRSKCSRIFRPKSTWRQWSIVEKEGS